MTSISSSGYPSPLQQLQAELQSEANSGDINSSDQSALSSALTDINSSLQTGAPADATGATSSSPGDIKSKIDGLIAGEVSSGKLTTDQATELQGVFQAAFSNGPGDAGNASVSGNASAPPAGAGGPPPDGPPPSGGPPPTGGSGGARGHQGGGHGSGTAGSQTSSAASSSSSSASAGTSANELLQQFLTSLKETLTASSPSAYSATGATSTPSDSALTTSSLLIDYKT